MNFQDYMDSVDKRCKALPFDQHLTHMGLGVIGEIGEIADALKKTSIYGKTMDVVHFKEEVGDCAWYAVGYALKTGVLAVELEAAYERGRQDYLQDDEYRVMTDGDFMALNAFHAASIVVSLMDYRPYDPQAGYDMNCARSGAQGLMAVIGSICARLQFDIHEIFAMNDAKLEKRYGQRYSGEAALNRDVAAERKVLEDSAPGKPSAGSGTNPATVSGTVPTATTGGSSVTGTAAFSDKVLERQALPTEHISPSPVSEFNVEGRAEFVGYPPAGPLTSAPDQVWDVMKGRFVHRSELGKE